MGFINRSERKNFVSSLSKIGTDGIADEEAINRIVIVNRISLTVSLSLLIIGPIICYCQDYKLSLVIPLIVEFFINFSVVIFNKYRKYLIASLILYFLQVVAVAYFSIMLGRLLQLELVIALQILVTYLIFKSKLIRKIAIAGAFLDLVVFEVVYYNSSPLLKVPYLTAFILHVSVIATVISIIILASKPYVRSNDLKYELKRANHFIKMFTAQVTHELRSPLNAIHQIAQLLKLEIKKDKPIKEIEPLVHMSLAASHNARNIVNNVLSMAEIESGKIDKVSREPFLVNPFFKKLIEWNEVIANIENVRLKLIIEEMPAVIVSDPINLNEIVTNLLANAIKYGTKGGTVTLKIKGNDDKWTLQVINRGPGIPPDKIAAIFDPFTTFKAGYEEGTGLGLCIVSNKVAALNGIIEVESEQNKYTTFTVTLPLIRGTFRDLPKEKEEQPEEDLTDLRSINILIAEDNNLAVYLLREHLSEWGVKATIVTDGMELLKAAGRHRPDIIIVDIHMPVMDGVETVIELKKNPSLRHIPIIVATGDLNSDLMDDILSAGADTYIEKPIEITALHKIISRYLVRNKD
jgi:signal transduction histidine kinase/CheY-like chemotaxis protein